MTASWYKILPVAAVAAVAPASVEATVYLTIPGGSAGACFPVRSSSSIRWR